MMPSEQSPDTSPRHAASPDRAGPADTDWLAEFNGAEAAHLGDISEWAWYNDVDVSMIIRPAWLIASGDVVLTPQGPRWILKVDVLRASPWLLFYVGTQSPTSNVECIVGEPSWEYPTLITSTIEHAVSIVERYFPDATRLDAEVLGGAEEPVKIYRLTATQ